MTENCLDASFERANALFKDVAPRLNEILTEEDAKIQLIVRILTELLGWQHADLSAERKHDTGLSDYIVSDNGKPAFLIEAKRQGKLELSTSTTTKQEYKISGPAIKPSLSAIEQAASYCAPEGIQLAVVTDGTKWIFFKPFVANANFKTKEAIVFPTPDSILSNYALFYELASKEAHGNATYKQIFDKIHDGRILLTTGLHSPYGDSDTHPEHKSQLAFDLDGVFSEFFAGLAGDNDPEMLIECFVETKESRIADFALEKLTTYVLGNINPPEKAVDESLQQLIASTIADKHGETVFIVGPPGAGKSTFLDRFFRKTLPKNIRDRCIVISIDALNASGDPAASTLWFTNSVITSIEKQLYEKGYPNWDQLLGLYHGEYLRRSEGVDAELYKRDKDAFKVKFGQYMDAQVEQDREGYLRRLLTDIVENRKRLPIFVIDNTDEFTLDFKQNIFQYFQALRRHAAHCLLLFPVTDRSAWSFSKTEIFNIYSSKSYFLPTPSPREVFRKRLDYLKGKISRSKKTGGIYGAGKSFKVKIENLEAFADAIEDIFVDQVYISNRIGSLANYNIRKTLGLARRVITSSELNIEDLLVSYIAGSKAPISADKFMRALLKGDYNFYKREDNHLIFPIFDVDSEIVQSPLMRLRVLALLKAVHDSRSSDEARYLQVSSLIQYFDAMGFGETAVERSLSALMEAGLVGAHDPSIGKLSASQRVAISYSGITHLEMALFSRIFFEQMALVAQMSNGDVALEIRGLYASSEPLNVRFRKVREAFASFLLKEDASFGQVPTSEQYAVQRIVSSDIRKYAGGATDAELSKRDSIALGSEPGSIGTRVEAVVDWFDKSKGYGFVNIPSLGESAFLHVSVLERCRIDSIHDGDSLVVDVSRSQKGIAVAEVHKVEALSSTDKPLDVIVVKMFEDRGYGFVFVPALRKDAFFHVSVLPEGQRGTLKVGEKLRVEINADPLGRGLQVRRVA